MGPVGHIPSTTPDSVQALTDLLVAGVGMRDPATYAGLVADRARELLAADATVLVRLDHGTAGLSILALSAEDFNVPVATELAFSSELALALRAGHDRDDRDAELLDVTLPAGGEVLVATVRAQRDVPMALLVLRAHPFSPGERQSARAFAAAATAGLAHVGATRRQAERAAEQSALRRAAERLNAHLDVEEAVGTICREAQVILGADYAGVYRRDGDEIVLEADVGLEKSLVGLRLTLGEGMAGKVISEGTAIYSDDYTSMAGPGPASLFHGVRTCYGAPLRWDGQVRGALSVGFHRVVPGGRDALPLLEAFAELASAAYRNAETATALTIAARTDALTGCLNHGAFVEEVARETARAERTGLAPALLVVDLDHFKSVNDDHGHRTGDDLLRAAGDVLRSVTRAQDQVGRLGGDEFGVLLVDADPQTAQDIGGRLLAGLESSRRRLGVDGTAATAGLAHWRSGMGGETLLDRADTALMDAKRAGRRGEVAVATAEQAAPGDAPVARPARPVQGDRLTRRMRSLALTNRLAVRIAGLTDVDTIASVVAEELHRAFDFRVSAVLRLTEDARIEAAQVRGAFFDRHVVWSQPADSGLLGRALRTRQPVRVDDVRLEPEYVGTEFTTDVRSECVVPLEVGGRVWGVVDVQEIAVGAFDDEDVRLLQTIASITGSALRAAVLYASLDGAYLGTVQALATALELKDGYTANHADAVGVTAEAVGLALGLDGDALRDLRLGAALHDVGKLAVPEAILNKPGWLTDDERAVVERHVVAGDQILANIGDLSGARRIVRHSHERFDGAGYPDRLAGVGIPLGARIVFVCDAYDAMATDRPYRKAMTPAEARAELRRHAGTQFDPVIVDAFLAVAP